MKTIRLDLFAGAVVCAFLQPLGAAQAHFRVIYTFADQTNVQNPYGVIRDAAGNLYGTGNGGGGACTPGCGTVFKIAPDGTETVRYAFAGGNDGAEPRGNIVEDRTGNLYGTTIFGGGNSCAGQGCGIVFKVAPDGTETILHSFTGGKDGASPQGGLVEDAKGNLYGTTEQGGTGYSGCTDGYGSGTIFKVTPDGKETVLHSFTGSPDGCLPFGPLIMDAIGNLYGTTAYGGESDCPPDSCGTVFKVAPDGTETVLYSFRQHDGDIPYSKVIMDSSGNLYGTTAYGGTQGAGSVFKVAPDGSETVLYSFCARSNCSDGRFPYGALFRDSAGNLYGETVVGGRYSNCVDGSGCGTVFKLAPDGTETVLHAFTGGSDGNAPSGGLIRDKSGHLYGAAASGGIKGCGPFYSGCGIVFRLDR